MVKFSIDFRSHSDASVEQMAQEMRDFAQSLSRRMGLAIDLNLVVSFTAQQFHPDCVQAVEQAAIRLGHTHMPVVSGAGHDAVYAARLAPTGMIFIPCKDGISHNEIEDALPEHVTAGCNVLLHAMLSRSG
jgi:beta-ureidopropionase / N-carbamoyl-L-amino-acid hydrolase